MKSLTSEYGWTYVPNMMWYMQDNDGDENFGLYRLGEFFFFNKSVEFKNDLQT